VLVVWKGVQMKVELSGVQISISVMTVAAGVTILQAIFVLPYLWRKVMIRDWQLKWYYIWQGPFLLKRPPPPPPPAGVSSLNITDYYHGHLTLEELSCVRASEELLRSISQTAGDLEKRHSTLHSWQQIEGISPCPPGSWNSFPVLFWRFKRIIFRGLEKDVIRMQKHNAILNRNIDEMHARTSRYDNRAEYMYSSLQIITASSASFLHGANDVSNAITPFASAYLIWQTGRVATKVGIPIWVL
jgi:sodium-dependent phosphate transporter